MPLPGQTSNTPAQNSAPAESKAPVVGFHKFEYENELPTPGVWHNAVLAERLFRVIPNNGFFDASKKGRPESKIILCFELEQKRKDGKPFVITADFFAGVGEKNTGIRKFCAGWAGEGKALTEEQWAQWAEFITGSGGPTSDTAECVGANVRIKLEEKESAKGRAYNKIADVEPPDDAHIAAKGGTPLTVSPHYKKWDEVQAEWANRSAKVPAGPRPDTSKEIPF